MLRNTFIIAALLAACSFKIFRRETLPALSRAEIKMLGQALAPLHKPMATSCCPVADPCGGSVSTGTYCRPGSQYCAPLACPEGTSLECKCDR